MCLIIMMVVGIKQLLSNTWSSIHEKVKQTETELKKNVAYIKKTRVIEKYILRKHLPLST